jgi:hypothetical protein
MVLTGPNSKHHKLFFYSLAIILNHVYYTLDLERPPKAHVHQSWQYREVVQP